MATHPPAFENHAVYGCMIEEDLAEHLQKVQVQVEGWEETTITCYWVTDGIDRSPLLKAHQVQFWWEQKYFPVTTESYRKYLGTINKHMTC